MKHKKEQHMESTPAQLATSRTAAGQERGVLAILRALAPRRVLNQHEVDYVAELQANRLLELAGHPQLPMPNELISELPRVVVRSDADLPASGSAQWISGKWLLSINGTEPYTRRRFSLAHEFKHVIDHRHLEIMYEHRDQAEYAADYFAACLLMPKRDVKRLWGEGIQNLSELSEAFEVSAPAMARRLQHLGLREQPGRSSGGTQPPKQRGVYYRPLHRAGERVAA